MRKIFMVLTLTILLATGNLFIHHRVDAASVSDLQQNRVKDSEIQNVNEQIKQVNQEIEMKTKMIAKANLDITTSESQVQQLKTDVLMLEDKINKRKNVLKERALSYQQSGGNISYLQVLFSSGSFKDFVDRVGAVAIIIEADRHLLEQQETDKKDYENKKVSLEKKLAEMANTKTDLEGIRAQLTEKIKRYEKLQEQIRKEIQDQVAINAKPEFSGTSPKIENGYINTIISAGYKYIEKSVYVFGGGRTEDDIANGRFDCSGFVHWAFAQAGIDVGFSTDSIKNLGRQVSVKEMQPGDLVFFDTYKKDGHVGIYIGDGKFIGSQSSTGVAIADMTSGYWKNKFNGRVLRI
ncbi:C40 family peptidase [Neobacillus ginsengisoli]|uniref:C40 family peptidase n=1 Tax=Neobacillus ginsengisoli TaxID=904295 RepID=UPI003F954D22